MAGTTQIDARELTPEQKALLTSPYGFGRHYLQLPIMDKPRAKVGQVAGIHGHYYDIFENDAQKLVLDDLDQHRAKVAARTCNGAGKTSILIVTAVYWFMTVFPRAKVVITSGVDRQVREQIFPALHAQKPRLAGWRLHDTSIDAPNGSHCVGFTTREGGYFEGWHGNANEFYDLLQHDGPLMIIVDEAKSVQPGIFDAVDRCTYQRLMLLSSCGPAQGRFHDAFTKEAAFYKTHQIPAGLCPYADHDKNRDLIDRRGLNDPLVKSKVFAEFMGSEAGSVISLEWVNRCRPDLVAFQDGDRSYFCDFAAGGDENVFAERRGNRVRVVAAWRDKDTMRACGEFIRLFRSVGLTQAQVAELVAGDNGGLGHVVIDRMHELGWHIRRDNGGEAAEDKETYVNRSAETWFEGARQIESGAVILEVDELTQSQLVCRHGKPASDGRMKLESKEDMAKRGIGSPDRADAILGAMRRPRNLTPVAFMNNAEARDWSLLEQMTNTREAGALAGALCE